MTTLAEGKRQAAKANGMTLEEWEKHVKVLARRLPDATGVPLIKKQRGKNKNVLHKGNK